MRTDGKAEVQHFVPQLLLRLHLNNPGVKKGQEQVWVFDKHTDKVFSPNTSGILGVSRFYEIELGDLVASLEGPLSKMEDQAAPILTRIVDERSLKSLTKDGRKTISAFLAAQFVRTPGFRNFFKDLNEQVMESVERQGLQPTEGDQMRILSDEEIKLSSLRMLAASPQTFGPHFMNKRWYLIEGSSDDPFHLGDHPVVRENELGGSIGIGSPGISIYLPLAPTLCLALADEKMVQNMRRDTERISKRHMKMLAKAEKHKRLGLPRPPDELLVENGKLLTLADLHTKAIMRGGPMAHDPQVVRRINALQMTYATRFVISSKSDFSLPREMIEEDEGYRQVT